MWRQDWHLILMGASQLRIFYGSMVLCHLIRNEAGCEGEQVWSDVFLGKFQITCFELGLVVGSWSMGMLLGLDARRDGNGHSVMLVE